MSVAPASKRMARIMGSYQLSVVVSRFLDVSYHPEAGGHKPRPYGTKAEHGIDRPIRTTVAGSPCRRGGACPLPPHTAAESARPQGPPLRHQSPTPRLRTWNLLRCQPVLAADAVEC